MDTTNYSFNDKSPIYNIRIIRIYIDYLVRNHPNINIDKLLAYAGISKLQFNDYGYWFNQNQANRFNKIIVEKTGNKNIAKDAARQLMKSQNLLSQYLMGFKDPESVALGIGEIYKKASIGAKAFSKKIGNDKYEIIIKPEFGVKEQNFQCQNRIGSMEGIFHFFTHEYPEIKHIECIHQGYNKCRYIIKIKNPSKLFKWTRIRIHLTLISIIISLSTYNFFPFKYFLLITSLMIFTLLMIFYYEGSLEKENLKDKVKNLSKTAEEHWHELNINYRTTKLMQEVGSVTSVIQSKKEIATSVIKVMMSRFDCWRCIILLKDVDEKSLFLTNSYGFTEEEITTINETWLRSENSHNGGVLQKVFVNQEPVLIDDINKISSMVDSNDLEVARKLKIQSMICVPILHEGESLGIIAVDNLKTLREFREGDINLLMAVAAQTALSIVNARSFQKLQESEKKHRTLVETIQEMVYTVDLEGRFTYVSPRVAMITGYSDKELLGEKFINIVYPPYREIVLKRFADGLEAGKTSTLEVEITTRDSRTVPVEINVAPLTNSKGQLMGRIGVARDITMRQMEEAKRQEIEVRALTQDKLASLGEIATGVAHEINQPLSYIRIILESTLSDINTEKLDRTELCEDFNESLRQVNKISGIISHLRNFGRSDVASLSVVQLSKVLNDTLILMNQRLKIKNIIIDIKVAEDLPMFYGSHVKLEQVFINLIQNSMDAMEEQGKGKILLTAEADNEEVLVVYSDTGEGVKPMMREKIFEPFFTTKEAGKGTGIGLSIVYGIIREHGGTIVCESEVGNGTTFKIRLPVYQEERDNCVPELLAIN